MVLVTCLLTDLIIILSYSKIQSINLQLHDKQIKNHKFDEEGLKAKIVGAKTKKSLYKLQALAQHHPAHSSHDLHPIQSS